MLKTTSGGLDSGTHPPAAGGKPRIRSSLKWAGSKYQILSRIQEQLPPGQRLIEPFVGSGAVFLNTDYPRFVLNDTNADLIAYYRTLKTEGEAFIQYARQLFTPKGNTEAAYYRLRDEFNRSGEGIHKAALFLYLNKHGYNGLCRYNASGKHNVPFGRYKRPYYPEPEMRVFLRKAEKASFRNEDFSCVMRAARPGDVVYCDPPYVPLSRTANFTAYSAGGFDTEQQMLLAALAEELAGRGITVVISNHHTEFTADAYKNARTCTFPVRRSISCNSSQRTDALEVLAVYS